MRICLYRSWILRFWVSLLIRCVPAGARLLPVSVRDGGVSSPKSASHMLSSLAAATHCAVLMILRFGGSAHEVGGPGPDYSGAVVRRYFPALECLCGMRSGYSREICQSFSIPKGALRG